MRLIGLEVARDVETLADDEGQWKGVAPELEVDPVRRAVVGRHIAIDERHEGAVGNPDGVSMISAIIFICLVRLIALFQEYFNDFP